MTKAKAEHPSSSSKSASSGKHVDGLGNVIPDDHFENEPGPPRSVEEILGKEGKAKFDAETARLKKLLE